jgi:putative NADH-flavin reductase
MSAPKSITVIGGTGYAGAAIAREAAKRGYAVTSVSRSAPADPIPGVTHVSSAVGKAGLSTAGADVIVRAFSPRADNTGFLPWVCADLAAKAAGTGARLVLVGGVSCLQRESGAPHMLEAEGFPGDVPAEIVAEAQENLDVLNTLLADTSGVDWLFVSPAMEFSAWQPGEDLGRYRTGDEVAPFDEAGRSAISGLDHARAVPDEIETPTRHRAQAGVAD